MIYQLRCCDDKIFEVDPKILRLSTVLSNFMDDVDDKETLTIFPVQKVNSKILAKLLEFCKLQVDL